MLGDEYEMGLPEVELAEDAFDTRFEDDEGHEDEDDGYQFTDWALI